MSTHLVCSQAVNAGNLNQRKSLPRGACVRPVWRFRWCASREICRRADDGQGSCPAADVAEAPFQLTDLTTEALNLTRSRPLARSSIALTRFVIASAALPASASLASTFMDGNQLWTAERKSALRRPSREIRASPGYPGSCPCCAGSAASRNPIRTAPPPVDHHSPSR